MFCRQDGRIFEGNTGDIVCDHYHRQEEDVELMKQLFIKAFRFSVNRARLLPNGIGMVNRLDAYGTTNMEHFVYSDCYRLDPILSQ